MRIGRFATIGAVALMALGGTIAQRPAQAQMMGMGMMGMGYGMMGMGCPAEGRGMMGRGGGMMGHMMANPEKMEDLIDERLAAVKKELGVGDDQKKAWDAYVEATKDRFTTMRGMHEAMVEAMEERKAVERMEARIGMLENMLDSMKALLPATKALYEALPDDKKKKADTLLGGCGMM